MSKPLIIAHRGASGYEPENTLRAFQRAFALHADGIELDVHCCGSGELVVIHDATLQRTTDGHGRIANCTLSELQKLDAGAKEKIPTLDSVLKHTPRGSFVNIELKGKGSGRALAQFLFKKTMRSKLLISSFHFSELNDLREQDPKTPLGLLSLSPLGIWEKAKQLSVSSINIYHRNLTHKTVGRAHSYGYKVFAWTVNTPRDIRRMLQLKVDGIITNYPDRIQEIEKPPASS
ncbi:MAG: glycerophosphodiester phosphodiesterase [Candidatus Nomurabacteria bacterium]|nr:MAG: glycerophosphodiester phosphodiesterase [Candidatus Nomurabacteria bacterium]